MAYDVVRNYTNVWTAPLVGGTASRAALRQLTNENQHVEHLRISHDGQWIAYDSDRLGNADIYKIRADGSGEPIQLTTHPLNDFAPDWSPDDREIVFHSARNGTRDIYTVSAEGTNERQVTTGPTHDYYPHFVDGNRIVFGRRLQTNVRAMVTARGADGTWTDARDVGAEPVGLWYGVSPDGTTIAFRSSDGIRTMPIAGGSSTLVTQGGASSASVDLAWHEATLYFMGRWGFGGRDAVWSVPSRGGAARSILTQDQTLVFGQGFATDGKRLFVTLGQYESDIHVVELKRQ